VDTYDLAHKLEYAGRRSPVPFITGPEYSNSVPGVPVLSELRVFIPHEHWSEENVLVASKEICRILGASSQFDIGLTLAGARIYGLSVSIQGNTARLMKLNPDDRGVTLRYKSEDAVRVYYAEYPRLQFLPANPASGPSDQAVNAAETATQK
jgi:hypothetical protein